MPPCRTKRTIVRAPPTNLRSVVPGRQSAAVRTSSSRKEWRTHDGAEVDFVIETANGVVVVEAKSGDRWERKFGSGLARFRAEHPRLKTEAIGVYGGKRALVDDGLRVLPWDRFLSELWAGELVR